MVDEFGLAMPDVDAKKPKKEQREQMEAVVSALGVGERQRIEEVAERIVLLSDGAGQDVIDGFKDDIFDDAAREAFAAIPNQRATYRANVVQGRKSMSWANSVLPVFMTASGQKPGRLPESAITVQIDTTLHRSEIGIKHGLQRFTPQFNRTVVVKHHD